MHSRILMPAMFVVLLSACDRRAPTDVERAYPRAAASASSAPTDFDFALDRLEVVGNIPGNFVDEFDDGSLTTPPTSHFLCFGAVAERGGVLVLTSADGANDLTPGVLVDNCFLGQLTGTTRLVRGRGDAIATTAFRADPPPSGQGYGMQIATFGSSETVGIQVSSDPRGVLITAGRGGSPPDTRVVDFTGVHHVLLRLELRDATGDVVPSFSTDDGSTFQALSPPGGARVFGTSTEAMVSVFGFMVGSAPPPPSQQPGVTDLGTLGGNSSNATAINAHGAVVGSSETPSGVSHAFLWRPGSGMEDLGTLGGPLSSANAVNDANQVAGGSRLSSDFVSTRAFRWSREQGMVELGTLGGGHSSAFGIDNLGRVVGQSIVDGNNARAFLWTPDGGMRDLGSLGGTISSALAINARGQVVGSSRTAAGAPHAYLWTAESGMTDLGTLGGNFSVAWAINQLGHVVGNSTIHSGATQSRAFLWTPGVGMRDLGTLGGTSSSANAINDLGQVVGSSTTASGEARAFLWTTDGGMQDLGTLGGRSSGARGINNFGQIVGTSTTTTGESHAALWTVGTPVVPVEIDVKPGSDHNPINPKSGGTVPVALLSSPTFNAASANRSSVVFAGAPALEHAGGLEDVDRDGRDDLVFHFRTATLNLPDGTTSLCLMGRTSNGVKFRGCDAVRLLK